MDKDRILIVDDQELNLDILHDLLEEKYDLTDAHDGVEALEIIRREHDQLTAVLLDVLMPNLSGEDVLKTLQQEGGYEHLPILVTTGDKDEMLEQRCLEYGAFDFMRKPFGSVSMKRLENAINLCNYRDHLEATVEEQTRSLREQNTELEEKNLRLIENNRDIIASMGIIVEARDMESGEHIKRVSGYSRIIGHRFVELFPEKGLTHADVNIISDASPLHDVGKLRVPDAILLKSGKLTEEERIEIQKHTIFGCEILDQLKSLWFPEYYRACSEVCRYHHERYDGKGYPEGIAGDDIPLSAQIVALADVYDALVSDRVYRAAFSHETAYEMIMDGKCGTFAPYMLECLEVCKDELKAFVIN